LVALLKRFGFGSIHIGMVLIHVGIRHKEIAGPLVLMLLLALHYLRLAQGIDLKLERLGGVIFLLVRFGRFQERTARLSGNMERVFRTVGSVLFFDIPLRGFSGNSAARRVPRRGFLPHIKPYRQWWAPPLG